MAACCLFRTNVDMAQKYEEIIANMTKPLGITIEESTDRAKLVYITSVGEKVCCLFDLARNRCMYEVFEYRCHAGLSHPVRARF